MQDFDLKTWQDDLENSIEKLRKQELYYERLIKRFADKDDIRALRHVQDEIKELQKERAKIVWMIKLEEGLDEIRWQGKFGVKVQGKKEEKSYWEIAAEQMKQAGGGAGDQIERSVCR